MKTIRFIVRAFKILVMLYGLWTMLMKGRWLAVGIQVWRALRGKPMRDAKRVADFTFVNAGEPAIYRRRGWRKIATRKIRY